MKLMVSQMVPGENAFHFDNQRDELLQQVVRQIHSQGYQISGVLAVDLRVTKLEPDYYLKGALGFAVQVPCARCAEVFSMPIQHSFELALAHVPQARGRTVTLAEESEELDINFFEGNEIDLVPIVSEQIVLSVPYRTLCRPDCRGICQKCGRNLNQGQCQCQAENPLNPFTALRGFKGTH